MKAYTDIEQSKKLAEILPLESADVLNGIHKTAKEMKDDVKRYKEKYGKEESDKT